MILKIIPFLVTMLVGIGMFKGAGGIDLLTRLLTPVLTPLQFPPDLLPLALMRPLSGSATLALLTDIIHRLGPDNIVSLMAATIYGSTETTFYVAAVFRFGQHQANSPRDSRRFARGPGRRHCLRHRLPGGVLGPLVRLLVIVIVIDLHSLGHEQEHEHDYDRKRRPIFPSPAA